MLQPGTRAPDFTLPDTNMQMVHLMDVCAKQPVVLLFFNCVRSPQALSQAIEFSELLPQFSLCHTTVLGVSLGDFFTLDALRTEEGIEFNLLSDMDHHVSALYDVLRVLPLGSTVKYSLTRATFVIGENAVLQHVFYNTNLKGHAAHVLSLLQEGPFSKQAILST